MTHREAATIAMREIGLPEEWIQEHHRRADETLLLEFGPGALAQTNQQIQLRPGQTDRDYIEHLKKVAALMMVAKRFEPESFKELVRETKDRVRKNVEGN